MLENRQIIGTFVQYICTVPVFFLEAGQQTFATT